MTDTELLSVELMMWKAIAASRQRHSDEISRFFEVACEIAHFWRDAAPDGTEYPAELQEKIDALKATA